MTIQVDNALPPNVVEIGNEITQGVVDGLMSASPSPSSSNPYLTVNGATFLPLAGGTMDYNANIILGVYDVSEARTVINKGTIGVYFDEASYVTTVGAGGISLAEQGGNTTIYDFNGITFPDSSVQTTAAVSPDLTGYLTKADNLNSVENKATARTNLGLSELATASFATNAESNKGTSASVALTPSNALWTAMSPSLVASNTWTNSNSSTNLGGGTSSGGNLGARAYTGTSAASYGAIRFGSSTSYPTSKGMTGGQIDFNKIVIVSGVCNITPIYASGTNRFQFGTTGTGQVTDLTVRGIGFRQVGTGAIELQVHNGTSAFNVTSSFTPSNGVAFDFVIYSDGAGNATLYINDTAVATSANAPIGNSGNGVNYIAIGTETSSNVASAIFMQLGNVKTYFGR